MGNTIRRKPISFNIPKEPDYKFLNIAKFGGLYETDNPLTADYRTASDLLNVYVDEYDALTTRPRVAAVFDLYGAIDGDILHTYSLKNSLFIKVEKDDDIEMYYVEDLYSAGGRTPYLLSRNDFILNDKDFQVLEYNDTLFVLNGSNVGYIHWESPNYVLDTIDKWEGFPIPLTKERITPTTDGVVTGSKNVFTNQYRQSFDLINWQTAFVADEIKYSGASIYKNNYRKDIPTPSVARCLSLYDDGMFSYIDKDDNLVKWGYCYAPEDIHTSTTTVTSGYREYAFSKTENRFVVCYPNSDIATVFYKSGNNFASKTINIPNSSVNIVSVICSNDGSQILMYDNIGDKFYLSKLTNGEYVTTELYSPNHWDVDYINSNSNILFGSDNSIYFLAVMAGGNSYKFAIKKYNDNSTDYTTLYEGNSDYTASGWISYHAITENKCLRMNKDATKFVVNCLKDSLGNDGYLILNYDQTDYSYKPDFHTERKLIVGLSEDGNAAYAVNPLSNKDIYFNGSFSTNTDKGYLTWYSAPIGGQFSIDTAFITSDFKYVLYGGMDYTLGFINENVASPEPLLELLYTSDEVLPELHLDKYIFFDNLFWFYSNDSNVVRWSTEDNPFDISVNNYDEVGDNTPIKDVELIGENALGLFKEKATYSVTGLTVGNIYTYAFTELVNDYGTVSETGVTLTPISKLPIAANLEEISGLYATKSIGTVNRYFTSITLGVDKKYKTLNARKLRAETFKYWNLFIDSNSQYNESKILVRDDRTGDYFYWEVPISIDYCWSHDKQFYMLSIVDNKIYTFYTTDIRGANGNPNTYEYYDNDRQLIKWYYKSQILTLGTINYTKRLINTTFVMSDNDIDGDGYALNFSLTHYKQTPYTDTKPKNVSSDLLKLIQSTTKRTIIPKLKFLQFELTNTTNEYYDNELDNNKFRLVGLAFKYTLLEGLY